MNVPIDHSCIGKERFASKGQALGLLRRLKNEHRLRPVKGRRQPRPYRCDNCHHWHIGSHFA
jgi:hypothetical protein